MRGRGLSSSAMLFKGYTMRKIITFFAALACAAAFATPAVEAAPALTYDLTAPGPNSKTSFGFVTAVAIGGTNLAADEMISPPLASGITAPSADGILSSFSWSGGVTDPFKAKFTTSAANANMIKAYLAAPKSITMAEHVTIYSYNAIKKSWYLAFDCAVNGVIQRVGAPGSPVDLTVSGGVVASQVVPSAGGTSTCTVNDGSGPMIKQLGVKVGP
jgi:hypothetical protein